MFESLPERIKTTRKEKGITQKALAEMTGISQPSIARYEKGALPPLDALEKIAEALGVTAEVVFN